MSSFRWGFLGVGRIARDFAQGLALVPAAQLVAVASRDPRNARAFADAHGARAESIEGLLGCTDVDLVYVATPNHLHRRHVLAALEAGKHVLVEKPFALDAAEARALVAKARASRLFLMEAMWSALMPAWRGAVDACRSRALGDLRLIEASLGFPFEVDPAARVFDPSRGGGALLDLGVYPLHFVHQVLGPPVAVRCDAVIGQTGVEESVLGVLEYDHGVRAVISTSLRAGCRNDAAVHGTHGSLVLEPPLFRPERYTLTALTAKSESAASAPSRVQQLAQRALVRAATGWVRGLQRATRLPALGNGYAHEVLEVHARLARGELESPLLPLDGSVAVLETVDRLRAGMGGAR